MSLCRFLSLPSTAVGTTASRAQGLSNSGKSEKACCQSGSLLLLFLFLLHWYPWRPHEQRACFRRTGVPSQLPGCTSWQRALLGIAHTLRNSAESRPPDVWVCFYPMSMLLISQRAATTTAVCACCMHVIVGREESLSHSGSFFALCCTLSDRFQIDMEKDFKN